MSIDYLTIRLLIGQLGLYEQKQLFYQLENLLKDCKINTIHTFEANKLIADLIYAMDEFFKIVAIFTKNKTKSKQRSFNRISMRLTRHETGKEWNALISEAERFSFLLKDTQDFLQGTSLC